MRFFMTAGQVAYYTGAMALPSSLPKADRLPSDGAMTYDANWFREALKGRG